LFEFLVDGKPSATQNFKICYFAKCSTPLDSTDQAGMVPNFNSSMLRVLLSNFKVSTFKGYVNSCKSSNFQNVLFFFWWFQRVRVRVFPALVRPFLARRRANPLPCQAGMGGFRGRFSPHRSSDGFVFQWLGTYAVWTSLKFLERWNSPLFMGRRHLWRSGFDSLQWID